MNHISFSFMPAVRSNTAVILALAGASGSGKTKSALLLASGLCGDRVNDGDILLIDSEGDRGLHYAPEPGEKPDFNDTFSFSHYSWQPPYTPASLRLMLDAAVAHKCRVVIIDSASDEFEGDGGLCDMKEAVVTEWRDKGWEVNDAACWAKPKAEHKQKIVRWLRNARCHVIFCLRADEKVEFQEVMKNGRKRTVVVPKGWTPICEKRLLYDVTTSLLFTPDAPGVPKPIKLYDKHARFFPQDRPVSRDAGRALAAWAAGGKPAATAPTTKEEESGDDQNQDIGFGSDAPPQQSSSFYIDGGRGEVVLSTIEQWRERWLHEIPKLSPATAERLCDRNAILFDEYREQHQGAVNEVVAALRKRFSLVSA